MNISNGKLRVLVMLVGGSIFGGGNQSELKIFTIHLLHTK